MSTALCQLCTSYDSEMWNVLWHTLIYSCCIQRSSLFEPSRPTLIGFTGPRAEEARANKKKDHALHRNMGAIGTHLSSSPKNQWEIKTSQALHCCKSPPFLLPCLLVLTRATIRAEQLFTVSCFQTLPGARDAAFQVVWENMTMLSWMPGR